MPRTHLMRRYQVAVLITIVTLIVVVIALQVVADTYTSYLWYRSIDETMVWRSMVETKLGLGVVFSLIFFVSCWASLWAVDRFSVLNLYTPEADMVRRYRASFARYRVAVRTVVSLALALAVGVGTSGQWQHWLLFENGGRFNLKDPEFGRDVGFYVFRLPFLSFLVDWTLVALVVLFIVTAIAHYLNGSLRLGGPPPRIESHVVAHLSLLLALMALVRAAGYFFVDRYALDLSTNGLVAGAGYTDVHVRLPALSVLAFVSLLGFVLLSFNVYQRTIVFPAVAFGMWAFLALMLGVIFPAVVQWLKVNPAQNTVEQPYIKRNIAFTRYAYNLNSITPENFAADSDLSANVVNANSDSLSDLPLWSPGVAAATYSNLQSLHGYYQLSGLSLDRYVLGTGSSRKLTPVVIAAREIRQSAEPRKTWVNEHLEYTHGYGVVISPANTSSTSGLPNFAVEGAPVQSKAGAPRLTQPEIYFGESVHSYVVANSKQPELDYVSRTSNATATSHYHGGGGVRLNGFWQRAAYALKFHDLNLLVSNLLTSDSRIIYDQDVEGRVESAAPFLKIDSHPYPVVAGGRLFWMVDGYTTTDYFPYSEAAATGILPGSSGLQGQYNYVRDAVKAVVNAYTGTVSLFAVDPSDPVLLAWEHAYPGLIKPLSSLADLTPAAHGALLNHLRYPQDLLTLTAEMYGHYHYAANSIGASEFYPLEDAWNVAAGLNSTTYAPTYELLRLPGQSKASFTAVEPLVPQATGSAQLLAGFLTAASDQGSYGSLTAYELPRVSSASEGPEFVEAKIQQYPEIARQVTLLSQNHSEVLPGPALLVPIEDSLIYVQAIFVSNQDHPIPTLEYVATDFGGYRIGFAPTLLSSLRQIFGSAVNVSNPRVPSTISAKIERDLSLAYQAYERAESDEQHLDLGGFQQNLNEMGRDLAAAHALMRRQHGSAGSGSLGKDGPLEPKTTTRSSPRSELPSSARMG